MLDFPIFQNVLYQFNCFYCRFHLSASFYILSLSFLFEVNENVVNQSFLVKYVYIVNLPLKVKQHLRLLKQFLYQFINNQWLTNCGKKAEYFPKHSNFSIYNLSSQNQESICFKSMIQYRQNCSSFTHPHNSTHYKSLFIITNLFEIFRQIWKALITPPLHTCLQSSCEGLGWHLSEWAREF